MVFPVNFEDKTGFSHIRQILLSRCNFSEGIRWGEKMSFSSDFDKVKKRLTQTEEMVDAYEQVQSLPLNWVADVTSQIESLQPAGAYLEPKSLKDFRTMLVTAETVAAFFRKKSSDTDGFLYPELYECFEPMESFPAVIKEIDSVITEHSTVKDTASAELAEIRRNLQSASSSISGLMRRVIDNGVAEGILERQTAPTLREGRLMLPVPANFKRSIDGIVVDESASGKTVFVEPAAVVEANNRIRKLQLQEKAEILRILTRLVEKIRPELPAILSTFKLLGLFDFIMAKAWVAKSFGASMPVIHRQPVVEWYHAVHPILESNLKAAGREAVPLNINLDQKNRILVISGPNAGGKSVALKTIGINQYMLQCGMLPMMHSNSHVSVFDNLLLDIGDEQSIENELSTYSSHLKNMKLFLSNSGSKSLFLIDEMGSGTEPHFGGALARSILERLNESKSFGVVTTHYHELKSFAEESEGVVNGAMLYDRQKMQPLFQLSMGSPGSSFALEIAKNTGLPQSVIDKAKEIVGADYVNSDKYMLDIARDRRYWANKRLSIKEKEHKLEKILEEYEEMAAELKNRKVRILADARKQAADILKDSNAALEKTILEIRKSQAEKERTKEVRKELESYKRKVGDTSEDGEIPDFKSPKTRRMKPPKSMMRQSRSSSPELNIGIGTNVTMEGGNSVGSVTSIEGNKATVMFGPLKTIVPLDSLIPTLRKESAAHKKQSVAGINISDSSRTRRLSFSRELDVRGMRVDEALQAVTYFLDDAVQFEANQVRILHGTGTGALRLSIRQFLQTYPAVSTFGDEDVRFGGAGITVVSLT